jgi:ComF family protein
MPSRLLHWTQLLRARIPALLPTSCALCGIDSAEALCQGCHQQYFSRHRERCPQCATPVAATGALSALCGACLKSPPAFDATLVATDYAAPMDQLVLALKFGSRLVLAPLFARLLCDALLAAPMRSIPLPTLLLAVPLSPQRLAERGFNQALEIAKPLSRTLGIALDAHAVSRVRNTQAQAMLHPDERRKNIRNAFTVSPQAIERMRGQHVGIIDDVITTGETLNELAATLKRFGATRVTNLVFARTLPH